MTSAKIFGIGLSKTGTSSLSEALEILGYSTVHFPRSLSEIAYYDAATDSTVAGRRRDIYGPCWRPAIPRSFRLALAHDLP